MTVQQAIQLLINEIQSFELFLNHLISFFVGVCVGMAFVSAAKMRWFS